MMRLDAEAGQMQHQLDRGPALPRLADLSSPARTSGEARTSSDPQDRLLAHTLETLDSLLPLSAAFAFAVTSDGLMRDPILLRAGGTAEALGPPRGPRCTGSRPPSRSTRSALAARRRPARP